MANFLRIFLSLLHLSISTLPELKCTIRGCFCRYILLPYQKSTAQIMFLRHYDYWNETILKPCPLPYLLFNPGLTLLSLSPKHHRYAFLCVWHIPSTTLSKLLVPLYCTASKGIYYYMSSYPHHCQVKPNHPIILP